MDISTIKPPVATTEGEPHAGTPEGFEPGFLQLLAGLGFTQPIPVDAGEGSTANDGTLAQIEALCVVQGALACVLAANGLQEKMMTVENANVGVTQEGTKPQALLANVITSAGKTEHDSTETALLKTLSTGAEDMPVKDQAMTAEGKPALPVMALPGSQGAAESLPQAATPKDESQAAPARLMEVVFSGHGPKEHGSAAAASPLSTGLTPNVASQLSMSPQSPAKQTATTASSLVLTAGMESSDLPQSGTDNNAASAEHDGWKERFTQAEADGGQPTLTPVTSSLSSQSVSTPTRTAAPAVVEAPTVTAHPESPLPASVRFEVQPGDMGRIRVHLSVVDHTVYTNVLTERVEAHDFLIRNSERFESGLTAHGLEMGRFQVDVQSQARQHADRGGTGWSQDDVHRRNPLSSEQPVADRHAGDREPDWMDRMINVFA